MSDTEREGEGPADRLDPERAADRGLDPERAGDGGRDPERAGDARPARRLDPDRAAEAAARRGPRRPPPPVIDTRRYQRVIGLVGLTLVVVVSVAFLTSHGVGTAGIPSGRHLRFFAAPLANSSLNGDANLGPRLPCTLAKHDRRALNICLISKHRPLVLAFFVTGSGGCVAQVTALQTLSKRFPQVQFAAVAIRTNHHDAAAAVKEHHWTIPVAYDADGAVGEAYGVEVCPIVELAAKGGLVKQRLIGERWNDPRILAVRIRAFLKSSGTA